ncbi:Fic/DOC family protein [Steroidobacter flavus]|uniref:Fic/DOC family protein n=1 Tax=Steroidobacter flavus TaxID=1842136 RepID=A0ABV8T2D4_9GAMM
MTASRYEASGLQTEFEPGSRRRVLRNLLGIVRARDIAEAESQALAIAQEAALDRYGPTHRFSAKDVCELHRLWLGPIYPWAGKYRSINIGKGGFQFAHVPMIPRLMREFERGPLRRHTPCNDADRAAIARALAEVHAELILVHPFRDGNGRLARLLALLMALQAGLPPLDFSPLAGRGKRVYISAIHAAMARDYEPLTRLFLRVIDRSRRLAASNRR